MSARTRLATRRMSGVHRQAKIRSRPELEIMEPRILLSKDLIGSTRETVSLTLSQFKRKGFIETEGRKVILADREGLRSMA